MFGFFSKKGSRQARTAEPSISKAPLRTQKSNKLTEDDLRILFEVAFRGNAAASMFYARCAGMAGDTLSEENSSQYVNLVLSAQPEDFLDENVKAATSHRLDEIFDGLLGEYWKMSFSLETSNEATQAILEEFGFSEDIMNEAKQARNTHYKDDVARIREKALRLRMKRPYERYIPDFDLSALALSVCLERRDADIKRMTEAVDAKLSVLGPIMSRLRNSSINKYGDYDPSPELDELHEFLEYTFPDNDFDFYYVIKPVAFLCGYIDESLSGAPSLQDIPLDGIAFEHWCAEMIKKQGWEVSVSAASGDQGVDVVARRDAYVVAIQCKRYSSPVGNKAVQEAYAGKSFIGADAACVISTAGYTKSAREIAGSTGVELLDAYAIDGFSEKFGFDDVTDLTDAASGEEPIHVSFESPIEGLVGSILRSSLINSPVDEMDIRPSLVASVLSEIDRHTGLGAFSCTAIELAMLLLMVEHSLSGIIDVTSEMAEGFLEDDSYDAVTLASLSDGDQIRVLELFSPERLAAIDLCVDELSRSLPEPFASYLLDQLSEHRAERAG